MSDNFEEACKETEMFTRHMKKLRDLDAIVIIGDGRYQQTITNMTDARTFAILSEGFKQIKKKLC